MKPFKNGWYTLAWHQTYFDIKVSSGTEEQLDKPGKWLQQEAMMHFCDLTSLSGGLIHHNASGSEGDEPLGDLLTQSLAWEVGMMVFFYFLYHK